MKYIGESPDGNTVFSYRTDRVRKEQFGGFVSAWLYGDNKKPAPLTKGGKPWKPYMRSVENVVFSCTTASYYTDSSTYYDGNGGVLASVRRSNVMERAIPDTVADIMMRAVCLQVGNPVE